LRWSAFGGRGRRTVFAVADGPTPDLDPARAPPDARKWMATDFSD